ncbi:MAG: ABC transporter ATP-binding protein, partial [Cyclobacteriaceae bacterium]
MVEIRDLVKVYHGAEVINISELDVPSGQTFGLVGNNGAGKTTLFRLVLDLIRPTRGQVLIGEEVVSESEDWKFGTGSFIDEKFLLGYLTPGEYFQFLAKLYRMNEQDLEKHLARFERLFHGEILNQKKYIRDLSKGNKKKVGIAGAFMGDPQLIILDEPFENLDPTSQIHLKEIIRNHISEKNATFLISSHDLNHVTDLCERIVLLEKGRIKMDEMVSTATLARLNDYFGGESGGKA